MIACLSEYFREQRIVAPLSLIAYGVEREEVLEDKAREVPRSYHILIGNQFPLLGPFQLSWCGWLLIAIQLSMMTVIALADNQYNMGCGEGTAVHLYLINTRYQFLHLFGCELVCPYAEGQSVQWLVEVSTSLFREFMLHLSDGLVRHQPMERLLVLPAVGEGEEEC